MLVFNGFQHYSIRYGSKLDTPKIARLRRKLVPHRSPLTIKCLGFASDAPKNTRISMIFHIYSLSCLTCYIYKRKIPRITNWPKSKILHFSLPCIGAWRTSFAGDSPSLGPPTSTAGQANLPAAAAGAAAVPAALLGAGVGAWEPEATTRTCLEGSWWL